MTAAGLAMNIRRQFGKYVEDWRTFPGDARLAYRLEGLRGVWDSLAERTVRRILTTGHVVIFAQVLDSAPEIPPPPGVVIRPLDEADWPVLSSMVLQRNLARFRALVTAGRHGLIAWRDERPIGYGWVSDPSAPMSPLVRCRCRRTRRTSGISTLFLRNAAMGSAPHWRAPGYEPRKNADFARGGE